MTKGSDALSWTKTGSCLVALITVLASIPAIYDFFLKDDNKLEAELTYSYMDFPSQYVERMNKVSEKLKYDYLYDHMKRISNDSLNHEQLNKLVELSQAPFRDIYEKPFQAGLAKYQTELVIHLSNSGDKVVKDVHITLPAKGLVQIRDEAKNDTLLDSPVSTVKIPAIVQNGTSTVWVFFEDELKKVKQGQVNIGFAEGVAKVEVNQHYSGFDATVAKYSEELMMLVAVLVFLVLFALYLLCLPNETTQTNA